MSAMVKMRVAGTRAPAAGSASSSASGSDRVQRSMISSSASLFLLRPRVVGEARVLGELRLAHRRREAAEQVVGLRGDVDVAAVARRIEIVGRAADQARAGAVRRRSPVFS